MIVHHIFLDLLRVPRPDTLSDEPGHNFLFLFFCLSLGRVLARWRSFEEEGGEGCGAGEFRVDAFEVGREGGVRRFEVAHWKGVGGFCHILPAYQLN